MKRYIRANDTEDKLRVTKEIFLVPNNRESGIVGYYPCTDEQLDILLDKYRSEGFLFRRDSSGGIGAFEGKIIGHKTLWDYGDNDDEIIHHGRETIIIEVV